MEQWLYDLYMMMAGHNLHTIRLAYNPRNGKIIIYGDTEYDDWELLTIQELILKLEGE